MDVPKETAKKSAKSTAKKEYTITKKRSGRYAVTGANRKPVNGDAKVEILLKEGLIKKLVKQAKPAEEKTE